MKKNILLIGVFLLTLSIGVNADYRVYDNMGDFEKEKGLLCETATDGCNTYFMQDGKVSGGTEMYCVDHVAKWSCKRFIDNIVTTKMIKPINEDTMACTMDYTPVCSFDGKTYSNSCVANSSKAKIAYTGECRKKGELSENDKNFKITIKNRLDYKYQNLVNKTIYNYLNKLDKYSDSKKQKLNDLLVERIDEKISSFLMKYPQDIALPEKANNKYLTYALLKFELMSFNFESGKLISWNKALEIAKDGNIESMGQTHSLTVEIITNDGKTYTTKEPKIDEYMKLKELCGDNCDNITIWTE